MSGFLFRCWVVMWFVHYCRYKFSIPANKELVAIEISSTHHRRCRDVSSGGKDNAVDKTLEFPYISDAKLPDISRMKAWISCYDYKGIVERPDSAAFN